MSSQSFIAPRGHASAQTKFTYQDISPRNSQNYVPFLAKANRFIINKQQQLRPPVGTSNKIKGSYNMPSCFDKKRSFLEERAYRFLLESVKKKQEMNIFKSSLNRFQHPIKDIPGPASYNLFKKNGQRTEERVLRNSKKQKPSIEQQKSCPSIPHKENKYGYANFNGKIMSIFKNQDNLEKQKQSLKDYLATLDGQQQWRENSYQMMYVDQRKKLYQDTHKIISHTASDSRLEKSIVAFKKPKYEHLYHSKGVTSQNNSSQRGPGCYDLPDQVFAIDDKKQKFQFFGSTEVRFKEKCESPEKGYTLIQMIKENKKYDEKQKKSPILSRAYPKGQKSINQQKVIIPGPGQYDPNDNCLKKSRGAVFFAYSDRFQDMYGKSEESVKNEPTFCQIGQKAVKIQGKLKKNHFKTMQKTYHPVKSTQICGILSKGHAKENENQDQENINSWSREDKRGQYIKELKEQLAMASQTPLIQDLKNHSPVILNQKKD